MRRVARLRVGWLALALAGPLLISALALGPSTSTAKALTSCNADTTLDSEETAFLTTINSYRAQNGLGALTLSTNLDRSAAWLAADMGAKNYFSHTDSLGRDPSKRAQDCGYPSQAGENIAAGTVSSTAQQAFAMWKASAGHNANMLNGSYKQIGIARAYTAGSTYGWYWVTDFGVVNDGTGGGSTGGGGTTTPPPTTPAKASMTSPAAGSVLPGSSATFSWDSGTGAQGYFLYVGRSAGSNDIAGQSTGLTRTSTVSNLPTDGSTVYVRLWTLLAGSWQFTDYTYRAATTTSAPPPPAAGSGITSPAPGSTLHGATATFSWAAVTGAAEYFFYAGTSAGTNNLYGQSVGTARSATVTTLPRSNQTIYVRLWWRLADGWHYTDTTYISAP